MSLSNNAVLGGLKRRVFVSAVAGAGEELIPASPGNHIVIVGGFLNVVDDADNDNRAQIRAGGAAGTIIMRDINISSATGPFPFNENAHGWLVTPNKSESVYFDILGGNAKWSALVLYYLEPNPSSIVNPSGA